MPIEKLHKRLFDALLKNGINTFTPLQEELQAAYKSGGNVAVLAPDGSGKSTSIVIHTLEKVKEQAPDDAPRAIVISDTIDNAVQLEELIKKLTLSTEIRTVLIHDKANSILQRNDLFDGCDIMVGNINRISNLYLQNGFSVKHVKVLVIDNLDKLLGNSNNPHLVRLMESMPKVQKIVYRSKETARTEKFLEDWMERLQWIEME